MSFFYIAHFAMLWAHRRERSAVSTASAPRAKTGSGQLRPETRAFMLRCERERLGPDRGDSPHGILPGDSARKYVSQEVAFSRSSVLP